MSNEQSLVGYLELENNLRFPYPIKIKKTYDVINYLKLFYDEKIIERVNTSLREYVNSEPLLEHASIKELSIKYVPERNNAHMSHPPMTDKIIKRYQGLIVEMEMEIEMVLKKSKNYVKVKSPSKYEEFYKMEMMGNSIGMNHFLNIWTDIDIDDYF